MSLKSQKALSSPTFIPNISCNKFPGFGNMDDFNFFCKLQILTFRRFSGYNRFCHAAFSLQRILWGWVLRMVWAWRQEERIQQETKPNHIIRNHIIKRSQNQAMCQALNHIKYVPIQNTKEFKSTFSSHNSYIELEWDYHQFMCLSGGTGVLCVYP